MQSDTQQSKGSVPLAELTSGDLNAGQLQAWAAEIAELAEHVEVRLKGAGAQRADAATVSLTEGLHALTTGTAAAMQVRYKFDDRQWADTALPLPGGGARVLRAALPSQF